MECAPRGRPDRASDQRQEALIPIFQEIGSIHCDPVAGRARLLPGPPLVPCLRLAAPSSLGGSLGSATPLAHARGTALRARRKPRCIDGPPVRLRPHPRSGRSAATPWVGDWASEARSPCGSHPASTGRSSSGGSGRCSCCRLERSKVCQACRSRSCCCMSWPTCTGGIRSSTCCSTPSRPCSSTIRPCGGSRNKSAASASIAATTGSSRPKAKATPWPKPW